MRYYGMLETKFRRKYSVLTWVTVLAAAMAIVPLVTDLPLMVSIAAFGVIVVTTLWSMHEDYSSKATAANLFGDQYAQLSAEWRRLWFDEPTAETVYKFRQHYNRITAGFKLTVDDGLNGRAQSETYVVVPAEFGGTSNKEPATTPSA